MKETPEFIPIDRYDLLTIAFIVLKLIGEIDWSWWWVLFPFYVPLLVRALAKTLADWRNE